MRSPAYGREDEWYSFRLFINNTNGEPVRLLLAVFLSSLASVYSGAVKAQISYDLVRIGMLNDQSGIYADFGGTGSVIAARMAVEDAGRKVLEKPIDIVVGDHQSKVDIGTAIARQWFDAEKVDVTIGFDNSSVALAVEQVALQKNRIAIAGAVATTAFTSKNCTPNEASWLQDSYALTNTLARSVVGRGGDTWFFITVDYAFGHSLEADAKSAVIASGGKVLGSTRHPLNNADFSSHLLQAQASRAKVVALANAAGETRAWSKRFFDRHGRMPTSAQAAVYSAIRHYLRAIEAAGTDDAKAVMAKMREIPVNNF
jgi:branched-chain amino acid transport system substrate-binding protein